LLSQLENQLTQAGIDDKNARKQRMENAQLAADQAVADAQKAVTDKAAHAAEVARIECADKNGFIQNVTNACKICADGTEPDGNQGCKKTAATIAAENKAAADAAAAQAKAEQEAAAAAHAARVNPCMAVNGWLDAGQAQACLGAGKKWNDYRWQQIASNRNATFESQAPPGIYMMQGWCDNTDCNAKMFATNSSIWYHSGSNEDRGYVRMSESERWNEMENRGVSISVPGLDSCSQFTQRIRCSVFVYKCTDC
jgi:hypothetical protein